MKNLHSSNTNINNTDYSNIDFSKGQTGLGTFQNVFLKDEDIAELQIKMTGQLDNYVERLSAYIKSTGKTYKDHKATILSWFYIKSIDRLGRNYDEIIKEWNVITKEKNAEIIVLDFPLLDTRTNPCDVTGKFIADIVLQILSYVAQIERENTHQRQMEGIKEAKKRGVKFGRSKIEIPEDFDKIAKKWRNHEISIRAGAKLLNISHTTFSKWLKEKGYTR